MSPFDIHCITTYDLGLQNLLITLEQTQYRTTGEVTRLAGVLWGVTKIQFLEIIILINCICIFSYPQNEIWHF